jgi:hypothetical protein
VKMSTLGAGMINDPKNEELDNQEEMPKHSLIDRD